MLKKSPGRRSAALIVLLVLGGCASPPGGGVGGPPGGGMEGGGSRTHQAAFKSPIEQIHEQLVETAKALNLTPKQLVLWEGYQASVGALMADQVKQEVFAATPRTALQQINGKVDVVRNRLAAMEDIAERATALYQSFDEAQKKTADQRLGSTVPALYSGLVVQGGEGGRGNERGGPGQGGRGGQSGGGPGGGMGRF